MRIRKARFLFLLIAAALCLMTTGSTVMAQYGFEDDGPMPPPSYRGLFERTAYAEQDVPPPIPGDYTAPVGTGAAPEASYGDCYADASAPVAHTCRACDRWYVALSGGAAYRERVHEISDARTFIEFDTGFAVNAALGYRFDMFRVEAEYSFMNTECAEAGAVGLATPTVGNVNLKAFMFNVYHDFDLGNWIWQPYVGGGLGIYQSDINGLYPEFFDTLGAPFAGNPVNATSNMPFAYQFRAGLSRPIGERTEFYAGYRYFHGETLTFSSAPFASFAPTFNPNGAVVHAAEIGLRVRF
jgi:opacity protein-like surface antigen